MNRNGIRLLTASVIAATLAAAPRSASAHFVWATIENQQIRLALLEEPGDKPEAKFARYVDNASVRLPGGAPVSLAAPQDGMRRGPLPAGATVVLADTHAGVMERGGVPFRLEYHAKAAAGEATAATDGKDAVEVLAHRDGNTLAVQVEKDGGPVPQSEVAVYWPGLDDPVTGTTDASGKAAFPWSKELHSGFVGIRALAVDKTPGEEDGKKYAEVRHYATLTFPVDGLKADPAAWNLLKDASERRAVWAAGVTGLTGDITVEWNGKGYAGAVTYTANGGPTVTLPDASQDVKDWAGEQLSNLLGHRRGGAFAQGDGKYSITFAPADGSPLGPKVLLHDSMNSSYRVRDHALQEVDRTIGGTRLVITLLDFERPDGDHYLPKNFAVTYFDPKTGAVQKSEFFTDAFQQVEGNWVPASRRIVTPTDGGFVTRTVTLANVRLQHGAAATAQE